MARPNLGMLGLAGLALSLAGCLPGCTIPEECASGQVRCGGICVDPASFQTDAGNCGSCGVACGSGTCAGGVCQCTGGATLCDALNPRCRDLQTDAGACGACTTNCGAVLPGSVCQTGSCACGGANPDDCGTFCTDTLTDPQNCGADAAAGCGHPCPLLNDVCEAGTCTCPASLPDPCPVGTPTACVDLQTDTSNCGTCGNSCPTGATCTSSSCHCPGGQTVCGTTCVTCPTGASCSGNACPCPSDPVAGCGGACCDGGTSCCTGGACQTKHANGLGQFYFDCNPPYAPGQTTEAAARAAADAWSAGTTHVGVFCDPYCVARQTGSRCAVWCFGISNVAGRVGLNGISNVCSTACPGLSSPTWN